MKYFVYQIIISNFVFEMNMNTEGQMTRKVR